MSRPRTIPVGARSGRLVATQERKPGEKRVQCVCDCGAQRSVRFAEWGVTKSCGCLSRELSAERRRTHGRFGTTLYTTWARMIQRCTNPDHPRWADYGGRGITVCERWRDFSNFLADMGECPPGLTLDRIDNDGGYEPGNCRWADYSTQNLNRRPHDHKHGRDPETGRYQATGGAA
ncbi:hypothetical protein ACIP2X_18665 [Streptomyces sp. NPDC089424]|uniref:hypothetical protein n=1 Tax=Streptomyces sp. NPDC089424 TaxID=3365917 RepID=UPI0037F98D7B